MTFSEISNTLLSILGKVLPLMEEKNQSRMHVLSNCLKDIDNQLRGLEMYCMVKPTTRYHISALKAYESTLPILINGKIPGNLDEELQSLLKNVVLLREKMEYERVPEKEFKRSIQELRGLLRAVYYTVDKKTLNKPSHSTNNKSVSRSSN